MQEEPQEVQWTDLENVVWEESPRGYYYNGGTPEKIKHLQSYMLRRGFSPPVVRCHNVEGNVYYMPKDPEWTDVIIGASLE